MPNTRRIGCAKLIGGVLRCYAGIGVAATPGRAAAQFVGGEAVNGEGRVAPETIMNTNTSSPL